MRRAQVFPSMTLPDVMAQFPSDAECRKVLEELRWPDSPRCTRCNSVKAYSMPTRNQYDCILCGY